MPKIMPDWSKVRDLTWPVPGTYEAVILSSDEYAEEVELDDGEWEVRFKLRIYKCKDRPDGLIVLEEDGREVEEHELSVNLPTSGQHAWRLQSFLRVLGYPRRGRVEEVDTNDWHGKRVVVKIDKRTSKANPGREYHTIEWLGRIKEEEV